MKKWTAHAFPAATVVTSEKAHIAANVGLKTVHKWLNCVAAYQVVVKWCCLKGRAVITQSKNLL